MRKENWKRVNDLHKAKKVLIITYYWPPSGGPGVQRVLKFVKYLALEGWETVVLTVDNGEYPAIDESLINEIPESCIVYKSKSIEFFNIFKKIVGKKKDKGIDTFVLNKKNTGILERIAQWIRINLFIPDGRVGWKYSAIKKGLEIIEIEKPSVIFSSSPPHSLQLIANKLAKKTGLPWIADFRDPWTEAFWEKGHRRMKWPQQYNESLEEMVLNNADSITTVSSGLKESLRVNNKQKISVLSNGYDPDDFDHILNHTNEKFTICYTGYLARSQCPDLFLKSISCLPDELLKDIQINLFGKQDNYFWKLVDQYNLTDIVNNFGYVDHATAVKEMKRSDILLLLIPKDHGKGILTGKVFEYLAAGNYILGFGDQDDDAAVLINSCSAGKMISYQTDPSVLIVARWKLWKKGISFESNMEEVSKYSRRNLTRQLIKLMECV